MKQTLPIRFSSSFLKLIKKGSSKSLLTLIFILGFSISSFASSALFDAYVILNSKGSGNTYTNYSSFNGGSLGSFGSTETLILNGAQNKTYKNSGSNVTGGQLAYRVYPTGGAVSGFSFIQLDFGENYPNLGDQRWETNNANVNLLSGLVAGNYTLEVYWQAYTSDGDSYYSNSGNNYKVTFDFVPTTAIPDANFEQFLITNGYDEALDGKVITANISEITLLDIRNKNISSLVGIKDFTSLQKLYCNNEDGNNANTISELDVSGLTNLRYFYCQNNQITDLNISGLTNLQALDTSNNPLADTDLDVHLNLGLYYLVCQSNGLTSLNISGLVNLETLIVWDNNLSATLDLRTNPKLIYLDCDDNDFTTINVNGLSNLNQFYCSGNVLTSLDVRGLSNLANFVCTDNSALTCILVDDVAYANLQTTTVDPDPAAEGAFLWAKDDTAKYSYCNCDLTTTWDGSSWSNGAPIAGTYAAIISGDYDQPALINACSLTITNNAMVVIPSGFNVILNAPLIVESGSSFSLSNNANLIQTNKKSINSGAITVKRNSNPLYRLDYTMWSSPVTNAAKYLTDFSPLTSNVSPDNIRFYNYDSSVNKYAAITTASSTPFALGTGYLIRMPNTWADYPAGPAASWTGSFTGVPNNGNVNVAGTAGQFVAVGNPYPSTISADAFIDANSAGLGSGTLYFWRKTNGIGGTAYATYTKAGPVGVPAGSGTANGGFTPGADIAVGQGFITTVPTSGTIAFTNALRTSSTTAQFLRTKAPAQKDRVWINLSAGTNPVNQMLVAYMDGATTGVDAGIDGKYINDAATALTSNIGGAEYTIQGRPVFNDTDVVALNFKTDVAGTFTIAKDHADGVFATGQDIYLVDTTTGTETNLQTDAYTFAAAEGTSNSRFKLTYKTSAALNVNAVAFDENSIAVYKQNGVLNINAGKTTIKSVKVFDLAGRLIFEQKAVNASTTTLKNLVAGKQALLIQITSDENKVVTKKAIN